MRRFIVILTVVFLVVGQLLLASGMQAWSFAGAARNGAAAGELLFLPPTARPSLTPSLTPTLAATDTPAPTPTRPPDAGPNPTPTPIPPTPTPTPPTLVIAQRVVNVRLGPGLIYDVIGVARENERYVILGQFPPGDWLQIDFNGRKGWVFRQLVAIEGNQDEIPPITDIPPTPTFTPTATSTPTATPTLTPTPAPTRMGDTPAPPTEPASTATPESPTATPSPPMAIIGGEQTSIRAGPGLIYEELGQANPGEAFRITGLSVTGDWFQIDYRGQPGWVFATQIEPVSDIEQIPIIQDIPPTPTMTPAPATSTPTPAAMTSSPPPTPVQPPSENTGGPPLVWLLIGGTLALLLAAGVIHYMRRTTS